MDEETVIAAGGKMKTLKTINVRGSRVKHVTVSQQEKMVRTRLASPEPGLTMIKCQLEAEVHVLTSRIDIAISCLASRTAK